MEVSLANVDVYVLTSFTEISETMTEKRDASSVRHDDRVLAYTGFLVSSHEIVPHTPAIGERIQWELFLITIGSFVVTTAVIDVLLCLDRTILVGFISLECRED